MKAVSRTRNLRRRLFLQGLEDRSVPATFTVSNTLDTGLGSLRQAITDANAAAGADVIDATGVAGTISLATALPQLTDDVALNGPGSSKLTVTRSAAIDFRILTVNTASGKAVSVTGVSLTNGNADQSDTVTANRNGGGLFTSGANLTLTDVVVSGNKTQREGGGIAISNGAPGTLTMVDCTVSNNQALGTDTSTLGGQGGGLYFGNNGTLNMLRCTVSGNSSALQGGGFYFFASGLGSYTIRNSTITGNTATKAGGALCSFNYDGGSSNVLLQNSTVTGNSAGQGGGGLYATFAGSATATTPMVVDSSIIATNTAPVGPDVFISVVVNINFSLIGVADDGFTPTGANNQTGTLATPLNPQLNAPANNGGLTLTQSLKVGSAALNNGSNPAFLGTDQRGAGFVRTFGQTDIGSFEEQPAGIPSASGVSPNVTTAGGTAQVVTVTYADDTAIKASTIGTGDITVNGPGGFSVNPTLVGPPPGSDAKTIIAQYTFTPPTGSWDSSDNGQYVISVNANEVQDTAGNFVQAGPIGAFNAAVPQIFVVTNTNDSGTGSLRAVLALANGSLGEDTINFAGGVTGSINLTTGELAISDSVVINAPGSTKLTVNAGGLGRGFNINGVGILTIAVTGLTVTNGLITGAGNLGGGILSADETLIFNDVVISNNNAQDSGAGLGIAGSASVTLNNCVISGNKLSLESSGGLGGGIGSTGASTITLTNCKILNNESFTRGGGISTVGGTLSLDFCVVDGNKAGLGPTPPTFGAAGGLELAAAGIMNVSNSQLTNNQSWTGGGAIETQGASNITLTNTTVSGNQTFDAASGRGGGLGIFGFAAPGSLTFENSTIVNNKSGGLSGGGYHASPTGPAVTVRNSIIAGNICVGAPGNNDVNSSSITGTNAIVGESSITVNGTGNIVGTQATPVDAKLNPLANNGGPTLTHSLQAGSPALNAGSNPLGLLFDQRGPGFARTSGGTTDIGAFEVQSAAAPTVTSVKINNGAIQRSMVTSLKVTFSEAVTFPNGINAAFQLARTSQPSGGPSTGARLGLVNINAVQSGSDVVITFANGGAVPIDLGGSLLDGGYQLTVVAANVQGAGGNMAANFQTPTTLGDPNRIFRLFGDGNGTGTVDAIDFGAFRAAFGTSDPTFDYDGGGFVDATDFGQFRQRFGASVP